MALYGTIIGPQSFRYTFTDDDVIWTARMLFGEAGSASWTSREGEAILWTMANRFALRTIRRGDAEKKTFWEFIRTFSQPINPLWYQGGGKDPNPNVKDSQEVRREKILAMTMNDFRDKYPKILNLTYAFMNGRIPNDPYVGLVNFNMAGIEGRAGDIGPVPVEGVSGSINVFYKDASTLSWTKNTVIIEPPSGEGAITGSKIVMAGLGALLALATIGLFSRN